MGQGCFKGDLSRRFLIGRSKFEVESALRLKLSQYHGTESSLSMIGRLDSWQFVSESGFPIMQCFGKTHTTTFSEKAVAEGHKLGSPLIVQEAIILKLLSTLIVAEGEYRHHKLPP